MLQLVSKVRPLKFSDWFPEIHYWGKKNEFHQTMFNTFDGERLSVFRPALKLSAILSLFAFLFSVNSSVKQADQNLIGLIWLLHDQAAFGNHGDRQLALILIKDKNIFQFTGF